MSADTADTWVGLDDRCERGPSGEMVYRWSIDRRDENGVMMVVGWRYQAIYCGQTGPWRQNADDAYADAERLVEYARRWSEVDT